MAITNSFHSSCKNHSIRTGANLGKVERHNDRSYFNNHYDRNKIVNIVGDSSTLTADVKNTINELFKNNIEQYNANQKRNDRKIKTDAFTYFENNSKLDIASESILQLAGKDFWDRFRNDTITTSIRTGKEIVIKDFPEDVKTAMNSIFEKQANAIERIYETHKQQIHEKVSSAYVTAKKIIEEYVLNENKALYEALATKNPRERIDAAKGFSASQKTEFGRYFEAHEIIREIEKNKLLERIENNQLHINTVNVVAHYDEFSPHAHAVNICWADGFKSGLSSRVAKSIVLNRWSLEVIQQRLHEIAKEEMKNHQDIFRGETLADQRSGRNHDYTKEQITRKHLAELEQRTETAEKEALHAEARAIMATNRAEAYEDFADDLKQEVTQLKAEVKDLEREKQSLRYVSDYNNAVKSCDTIIDSQEKSIEKLSQAPRFFQKKAAIEFISEFAYNWGKITHALKGMIQHIKDFELRHNYEERNLERESERLDNRVQRFDEKVSATIDRIRHNEGFDDFER